MDKKEWQKPDFEVFEFCETKGVGKSLPREQEDYNATAFDENGDPIAFEPNFDEGSQGPS